MPHEFHLAGLDVALNDLGFDLTGELAAVGSLEVRVLVDDDRGVRLPEEVRARSGPAVARRITGAGHLLGGRG